MSEGLKIDQDVNPQQGAAGEGAGPPKLRQAYSKVRRELSEDELQNPVVQRLLVNDLDRIEGEVAELRHFRDEFHKCDKAKAVLEGARKQKIAVQIVKDVCFFAGGALVGIAPSLWGTPHCGLTILLTGFALIICGIVCRVVEK
jgi:hypothetical protein